jgi:hypothetical protein
LERQKDPRPLSRNLTTAAFLTTTAVLAAIVIASHFAPAATEHFLSSAPPLYAAWSPVVGPPFLVPLAIAACLTFFTPRLLAIRRLPIFLATLVAIAFAFSLALNLGTLPHAHSFSGGGPRATIASIVEDPFTRGTEYRAAIPAIQILGVRGFAQLYPELDRAGVLPQHVTTHSPGAPILLWFLWVVAGHNEFLMCLLVALVGTAGVLPTYAIAREVYPERALTARKASLSLACSVGLLLYAFTSMDVVFMTATAVACAAAVRSPRSLAWSALWGFSTTIAAALYWGGFAAGVVGVGMIVLATVKDRNIASAMLRIALGALGGLAALLLLRAWLGIALFADLGADIGRQTATATYARPFAYWLIGNLGAFFITAGLGQSSLFFASIWARWRERAPGFETVVLAAIALLDVSTFFRGETDHNWLFLLPLVCVVAGSAADRMRAWTGISSAQALVEGALLYTYW